MWENEPEIVILPVPGAVDEPDKRPVLYTTSGQPLVKRPIGFNTQSTVAFSPREKRG